MVQIIIDWFVNCTWFVASHGLELRNCKGHWDLLLWPSPSPRWNASVQCDHPVMTKLWLHLDRHIDKIRHAPPLCMQFHQVIALVSTLKKLHTNNPIRVGRSISQMTWTFYLQYWTARWVLSVVNSISLQIASTILRIFDNFQSCLWSSYFASLCLLLFYQCTCVLAYHNLFSQIALHGGVALKNCSLPSGWVHNNWIQLQILEMGLRNPLWNDFWICRRTWPQSPVGKIWRLLLGGQQSSMKKFGR